MRRDRDLLTGLPISLPQPRGRRYRPGPRADGTDLRSQHQNPRELGLNPRAIRRGADSHAIENARRYRRAYAVWRTRLARDGRPLCRTCDDTGWCCLADGRFDLCPDHRAFTADEIATLLAM